MEILTSTEFQNAFYTLNEARTNLNILENQVKSGKADRNAPSVDELEKIRKQLDDLFNLLMAIKPEDDHVEFDQIEKKSLSILSTTTAYCKLIAALLEVQDKLNEMEKKHRNKVKEDKEWETLSKQKDELKKNLEILMSLMTERKTKDKYLDKIEVNEVENFRDYVKTNFGFDVQLNPKIDVIV